MQKEIKIFGYKITLTWTWIILGILLICLGAWLVASGNLWAGAVLVVAGALAIFGPGIDVERLDSLEGSVENYGNVTLDDMRKKYKEEKK